MKPIRTLLVDDEPDALAVLEVLLAAIPEVEVVGTALSANEGIDRILEQQPDLVLLDVEMPDKTGFDLLKAFEKPRFKVVFVTAFDHYAIDAIKCAALDYLLKPIHAQDLKAAIGRVAEHLLEEDHRLTHLKGTTDPAARLDQLIITSKKGFITLNLDEVVSLEASSGNYAFFYMASGKQFLCTKPLNYYEQLLTDRNFFRIHRSHMVNLRQVQSFNSATGTVDMSDGRQLPVAVRRRAQFNKQIKQQ